MDLIRAVSFVCLDTCRGVNTFDFVDPDVELLDVKVDSLTVEPDAFFNLRILTALILLREDF